MIVTNDTTNSINPRQQQLDAIAAIEQMPDDGERWRAIQRFMFSLHPELVSYDQIHIASVKGLRMEQNSKTGASKTGAMRQLYSMPEYLYRALQAFDPEFQKMQSAKDSEAVKRFNRKIWRVFQEYRIAEVI